MTIKFKNNYFVNENYSIFFNYSIYNEEDNILNLYNEINKSLNDNQVKLYEIIFVDDCSTDKSNKIIKTLSDMDSKIKLLRNKANYGQSYSITKGIKNSLNNTIVTIDSDGQNNPFDILKLLKFITILNLNLLEV